jgi:hypothetical protein
MGIPAEAVAAYAERTVGAMLAILTGLGDELANERPPLPGANSPYAIVRHCLGVMEFWGGQVVAGRAVERDRAAEFRASGPVGGLIKAAQAAKITFRADAASAQPDAPPRGEHGRWQGDELETLTQGGALLHVLEELTQHLGQLELTRDILLNSPA